MTSIVPRLFGIYRASGYEPITGYSPFHFFNVRDVPFTTFLKDENFWGCPELLCRKSCFSSNFLI